MCPLTIATACAEAESEQETSAVATIPEHDLRRAQEEDPVLGKKSFIYNQPLDTKSSETRKSILDRMMIHKRKRKSGSSGSII
ncbi:unnamed protein product [Arctogadus glacialis]